MEFKNTPIVLNNTSGNRMVCSVESASIPLSYYTVNDTDNSYSFNGISGQLPNGNYNANNIATEITANCPLLHGVQPLSK